MEPELATVYIRVEAQAPDQQSALALLTERTNAVTTLVARHDAGVERSETSRLSVYPELHRKKTEKVRRYVGSASTTVSLHDFALLSDLLIEASAIELAAVDGPFWRLRADSPAYRQARVAAAADALIRARDYAAAYGAEVTGLIEIADTGMSFEQPPRPMAAAGGWVGQAAEMGRAAEPAIDFTPARQQVSGSVEARFALSQPHLPGVETRTDH